MAQSSVGVVGVVVVVPPRCRRRRKEAYLFGGKAAPGYQMAKLRIRLINDVAAVINGNPDVRGELAVGFIPNYGVSLAQAIIPAADLSVQISTAGKEASGTSNMKFALNGALTLGTLDGANVEIRDAVGPENFFLFGLTASEVAATHAKGYRPSEVINAHPVLEEVLSLIASGFFSLGDRDRYRPIVDSLRWHDPYMVCADFDAYVAIRGRGPRRTETAPRGRRWRCATSSAAAASPATPRSASTPRRSGASNRSAPTSPCSSCRSRSALRRRTRGHRRAAATNRRSARRWSARR